MLYAVESGVDLEDALESVETELALLIGAVPDRGDLPMTTLHDRIKVDAEWLASDSGFVWRVSVQHEPVSWGCVTSHVRVVHRADDDVDLHVLTETCPLHGANTATRTFGSRVAESAGIRTEGYSPFVVGEAGRSSIGTLIDVINKPNRAAPIVLLSGGRLAHERAESLINKLGGGALVAVIDGDASWELSGALGSDLGCYAGAVRVYVPGALEVPTIDNPLWVSRRVASQGWDRTEDEIVAATVAMYRTPLQPSLERELVAVIADAQRDADERRALELAATNDELRAQMEEASKAELEDLFDEQAAVIERLMAETATMKQDLFEEQFAGLQREERLRELEATNAGLREALASRVWHESDDEVVPADAEERVDDAIERLGDPDGPLVCTENALRSWRDAMYPDPPRMLLALHKLEEAATAWRRNDASIGERLADWLGSNYGLKCAFSDEQLERRALDRFEFETRTWSRIPHIKVDDAKHANQVGRIYFAVDSENRRLIVDHVGQKLYGL